MAHGGDVVKDDSGSYAVLTKEGSSASRVTAANVLDVNARLLGCAGQPSDAVSALHPSQNGRRSDTSNFLSRNVQKYG